MRKRSYSNLTCLHPLNSTASQLPVLHLPLFVLWVFFSSPTDSRFGGRSNYERRGGSVHFIISLPLLLLALFQIMKEEGRHLRLKPLPSCVGSSLSSLCLNCQWAQLGLCFQYPLSTLHVIRKENQNGSPTCFQGQGPP